MKIRGLVRALVVVVAVAGPMQAAAEYDDPDELVTTALYDCGSGQSITVTWGFGHAVAKVGDEVWQLPHGLSASGARYSDGTHEIWEHKGILRVTDGDAPPMECPFVRKVKEGY